jgi:hypothetical protein
MKRMNAKFHEFSKHGKGDINLSLFPFYEFCRMGQHVFPFYEFCRMGQQESLRFENMKMYTWLRGLQQSSFHIF